MNNYTDIRNTLETLNNENGGGVFGVADLNALKKDYPHLLDHVQGDYSRAIVCGIRLQRTALETITNQPTPLYFHNYRQANYQLDRIAFLIAEKLQSLNCRALAIPASQIINRAPMTGHISHKLLGYQAGLGFIGRNNLLVHPRYGAQLRYVSVLTDLSLEPDTPIHDNCGSCRACISACPANAIKEEPSSFELNACYAKLCEFTRIPFIGQHICGVCVKACAENIRGDK